MTRGGRRRIHGLTRNTLMRGSGSGTARQKKTLKIGSLSMKRTRSKRGSDRSSYESRRRSASVRKRSRNE